MRIISAQCQFPKEICEFCELTIHGFTLDAVIAVILGEEELKVSFWVLDAADLVFIIDKVALNVSIELSVEDKT